MSNLPIAAATLISEETRELIRAQDDSLLANQILFVSVLKTARDSTLPFKDKQKVFAALQANAAKMLDTRWAVGDTLSLLRGLAPALGVQTVLEGCSTTCPEKHPFVAPAVAEVDRAPATTPTHAL